ncbi:TetR/AcrR family transcriptional regulator [Streptomyces sp. NPDC002520]
MHDDEALEGLRAGLQPSKRAALLKAGLRAFLADGYSGSSVNRIAADAGVSIATLYRHFRSKTDLFIAVIRDLIARNGDFSDRPWVGKPPQESLTELGAVYLRHIHSPEHRALFRIIVRDSYRVKGLYGLYKAKIGAAREGFFTECVDEWPDELRTKLPDVSWGARVMVGFLHVDLFEDLIFSAAAPTPAALRACAALAASNFVTLVEQGNFLTQSHVGQHSAAE